MLRTEIIEPAVNDCINTAIKLFCLSHEVTLPLFRLDLKRILQTERVGVKKLQQVEHYLRYRGLVNVELRPTEYSIFFRVDVSRVLLTEQQAALYRMFVGFNPTSTNSLIHKCVNPQIDKAIDMLLESEVAVIAADPQDYFNPPDEGTMIRRQMLIPIIKVSYDAMLSDTSNPDYLTVRGLKSLNNDLADPRPSYLFLADLQEIQLTREQKERGAPLLLSLIARENIGFVSQNKEG